MSVYAVPGVLEETRWIFSIELVLRFVIAFLSIFFMYYEAISTIRDGVNYWKDPFNYVDISIPILNFFIMISATHMGEELN